jgi:hypothetical protein
LSENSVLLDPGKESGALFLWDVDGTPAHDHRGFTVLRIGRIASGPLAFRGALEDASRPPQSAIGGSSIVVADGASAGVLSPPRYMWGRHTSWTLGWPNVGFYHRFRETSGPFTMTSVTFPIDPSQGRRAWPVGRSSFERDAPHRAGCGPFRYPAWRGPMAVNCATDPWSSAAPTGSAVKGSAHAIGSRSDPAGARPVTLVPWPGSLRTMSVPPIASRRSAMPWRPVP